MKQDLALKVGDEMVRKKGSLYEDNVYQLVGGLYGDITVDKCHDKCKRNSLCMHSTHTTYPGGTMCQLFKKAGDMSPTFDKYTYALKPDPST